MMRFLPIIIVIVAISGALFYLRSQNKISTPALSVQPLVDSSTFANSTQKSNEERFTLLETTLVSLAKQIQELKNSQPGTSTGSDYENRIKNLENSVTNLQRQAANPVVTTTQTSTATSVKQPPVYIPLVSSGTGGDKDYNDIEGSFISLDPADYPGYTGIQLEANVKLSESVGAANLRLYNETDKQGVSTAVSTSASAYTLLTSTGFKLPTGRKTYSLQLQSTQGYNVYVENARLKVNF